MEGDKAASDVTSEEQQQQTGLACGKLAGEIAVVVAAVVVARGAAVVARVVGGGKMSVCSQCELTFPRSPSWLSGLGKASASGDRQRGGSRSDLDDCCAIFTEKYKIVYIR